MLLCCAYVSAFCLNNYILLVVPAWLVLHSTSIKMSTWLDLALKVILGVHLLSNFPNFVLYINVTFYFIYQHRWKYKLLLLLLFDLHMKCSKRTTYQRCSCLRSIYKQNNRRKGAPWVVHIPSLEFVHFFRLIPGIFCLRGQTSHTFTVSRIQTGLLVGRFVFTPTQQVASETFKETNHADDFCFKLSWFIVA